MTFHLHRGLVGLVLVVLAGSSTAFGATYQTPSQAFDADATIIANANNWTVQDVKDMMGDQVTFEGLVGSIIASYPNDYSSAIAAASPTGSYSVYFKGSVPQGVPSMIANSGLSVNTYTNTGKNEAEWNTQVFDLADFLDEEEITSYIVSFDSIDNIDVIVGEDQTAPTLPQELAGDVTVIEVSATLLTLHEVFGSSVFRDGTTFRCTSGFNVRDPGTGTTGVTSAGHCTGLDHVLDTTGTPVATTFQAQHRGDQGDFEWHTTTTTEPAQFWSDNDHYRNVESVKWLWFRNQWACIYGRASDARSCDQIYRTSITATDEDGVRLDHIVVMDENNAEPGDSGGTWSYGTKAIGIHTGEAHMDGSDHDCFSRAHRIDDALGVEVRTVP